jgi:hypothetical protein
MNKTYTKKTAVLEITSGTGSLEPYLWLIENDLFDLAVELASAFHPNFDPTIALELLNHKQLHDDGEK